MSVKGSIRFSPLIGRVRANSILAPALLKRM